MRVKRTIRGRSAKRKGSRAEIQVRNALRRIYPADKHQYVQRVPLSGAGAMKGDVMDMNDPDSCYEVKCQETLVLNDWWRQAKSQAGTSRTPILVVTKSYFPFYYMMHDKDMLSLVSNSLYKAVVTSKTYKNSRNILERLSEASTHEITHITLDGDDVAIISEEFYIELKKDLYYNQK